MLVCDTGLVRYCDMNTSMLLIFFFHLALPIIDLVQSVISEDMSDGLCKSYTDEESSDAYSKLNC